MERLQRLVAVAVLCLIGCGAAATRSGGVPANNGFRELVAREWEYQLAHSPAYASVLGDKRWNDRWDDRSRAAIDRDGAHVREVVARLAAIARDRLPADQQLDYDLLRREYELLIEARAFAFDQLPTDQLASLPEGVRQRPPVQAAYRFAELLSFTATKDYEDWLARLTGFRAYVDQVIALMREGMRAKRVHPRLILERIPPQIDPQLVDDPARSAFYAPFTRFPASVPAADRERLSRAARDAIATGVVPALRAFRDFLTTEYIPSAPEAVGIWQFPRGAEAYAHLARVATTTDLTPDQIHELGLAEVARIRGEMRAVGERAGFRGSLPELFKHMRGDPRFYYRTADEILLRYRDLAKRIDPLMVKLFKTLPRQPYAVEPTPAELAPAVPAGFYYPASADGLRPGTFQVNLYRPETRPRWGMTALTLHEAMPGHHLQVSLAAEQTQIPEFRRYGYYMAYGEGWGLYCETLGDELGLYGDPYDKLGQLVFEMWRAIRLVVDTGMHAKRWTRQQAIDYFRENTPREAHEIATEVDRYIANPGQALAYKIGQLKIRELRMRAEQKLGARFDVREFHDRVLLDGSLPLDILERRIDAWLATQR